MRLDSGKESLASLGMAEAEGARPASTGGDGEPPRVASPVQRGQGGRKVRSKPESGAVARGAEPLAGPAGSSSAPLLTLPRGSSSALPRKPLPPTAATLSPTRCTLIVPNSPPWRQVCIAYERFGVGQHLIATAKQVLLEPEDTVYVAHVFPKNNKAVRARLRQQQQLGGGGKL